MPVTQTTTNALSKLNSKNRLPVLPNNGTPKTILQLYEEHMNGNFLSFHSVSQKNWPHNIKLAFNKRAYLYNKIKERAERVTTHPHLSLSEKMRYMAKIMDTEKQELLLSTNQYREYLRAQDQKQNKIRTRVSKVSKSMVTAAPTDNNNNTSTNENNNIAEKPTRDVNSNKVVPTDLNFDFIASHNGSSSSEEESDDDTVVKKPAAKPCASGTTGMKKKPPPATRTSTTNTVPTVAKKPQAHRPTNTSTTVPTVAKKLQANPTNTSSTGNTTAATTTVSTASSSTTSTQTNNLRPFLTKDGWDKIFGYVVPLIMKTDKKSDEALKRGKFKHHVSCLLINGAIKYNDKEDRRDVLHQFYDFEENILKKKKGRKRFTALLKKYGYKPTDIYKDIINYDEIVPPITTHTCPTVSEFLACVEQQFKRKTN